MEGNEEAKPGLGTGIWIIRGGGIRLHAVV